MKRRFLLGGFVLALALLCGCGFAGEYVSVEDWSPSVPDSAGETERVTVRDYDALVDALCDLVYAGQSEGSIQFDSGYAGSAAEALDKAFWQLRRQDALCAYCVQDMSYDLTHIVTHDEAAVHILYAEAAERPENVQRMPYAINLGELFRQAMEGDSERLVLLIRNCSIGSERVKQLIRSSYQTNPTCAVCEPEVDLYMYSGEGSQRLFEINLSYGLSEDELLRRRSLLRNLDVASNTGAYGLEPPQKALAACEYVLANCVYTDDETLNTVYDALIRGEANSEGLALAYVELCHQLGIDCALVTGQRARDAHFWNIIRLGGQYYHVDLSACMQDGIETGFLLNDEDMWALCRWDTAAYASCDGELDYWLVSQSEKGAPEEQEEASEAPSGPDEEPELPPEEEPWTIENTALP